MKKTNSKKRNETRDAYNPLTWPGFVSMLPTDGLLATYNLDQSAYADILETSWYPWTDQAIDAIRSSIDSPRDLAEMLDPDNDHAPIVSIRYLCHSVIAFHIAYHALTKCATIPNAIIHNHFTKRADAIRKLLVEIRSAYPNLVHPDGPGIHRAIADAATAFRCMTENAETIATAAINNDQSVRLLAPGDIDKAFDRMFNSLRHFSAELYQVTPPDAMTSNNETITPGNWAKSIFKSIDISTNKIVVTIIPDNEITFKRTPKRIAAIRALAETSDAAGWVDLTKIKCDGKPLPKNAQSLFANTDLNGHFQTKDGKCRINFQIEDIRHRE